MNKVSETENAVELIENTIYELRVDAAYLRMQSRDQAEEKDAEILRKAAEQISRLTLRLERSMRS
jgi:hypothetical protein